MTPAEELLWQHLRGRRLGRLKFRRQHVISGFIADFYCEQSRLAVEVDGSGHLEDDQRERDGVRENVFLLKGIATVRFTNAEVLGCLDSVLARIEALATPRRRW